MLMVNFDNFIPKCTKFLVNKIVIIPNTVVLVQYRIITAKFRVIKMCQNFQHYDPRLLDWHVCLLIIILGCYQHCIFNPVNCIYLKCWFQGVWCPEWRRWSCFHSHFWRSCQSSLRMGKSLNWTFGVTFFTKPTCLKLWQCVQFENPIALVTKATVLPVIGCAVG